MASPETPRVDTASSQPPFDLRWESVKERLAQAQAQALVITGTSDLMFLCGYEGHSWERITALVISIADDAGEPTLFSPALEVPKIAVPKTSNAQSPQASTDKAEVGAPAHSSQPVMRDLFQVQGWTDDQAPLQMIAENIGDASRVLLSDEMWARDALGLQKLLPNSEFVSFSESLGGLRSIKTPIERDAIAKVGSLADIVATQLQNGEIPLIGRSEADIAQDITERLLAAGHETVEFCIVASGPNSASPHHRASERIVQANEMLLCDFGGKHNGYCSDITRCVYTGEIPQQVADIWRVLQQAQQVAYETAQAGNRLQQVDLAARDIIDQAGYGEYFIHRTGHGIGTEVHEQPYVTASNSDPIKQGHAFSIEPGIYFPDKWGIRLEDIVVIEADGPRRCTVSSHNLVSVVA